MFIKRLGSSYASVAATAALVLALTMGGAYAAGKIGAKKIATGAISSKHIKDGQVTSADLAADAVVGFAKQARAAETADTAKIADRATTAETAGSARSANVAGGVTPNAVTGAGVADGSLGGADLTDGGVGTAKLANDSVTAAKIGDNAVGSADIADGGVSGNDIRNGTIEGQDVGWETITGRSLATPTTVVSNGMTITPNQYGRESVTCPLGTVLLAGGFAWQDGQRGESVILSSAPNAMFPRTTWQVEGYVGGPPNGENKLYAWANCL